ncbi:MAG: DUF6702 family protein [Janthinobacterium lividum]
MRRRFLPVLLLLPLLALARHTYHSSILELRINPQQQQVELALKVFTDDLENALSKGRPQHLSLQDPRALPLADAYLRDHLALALPYTSSRQPRLPLTLKFVGMQPEKDAYWLYAKAALPRAATAVWLQNTVMLDLFSDQMNIVNAESSDKKVSELYRAGHEQALLTLK